jgi:hypothetical protein
MGPVDDFHARDARRLVPPRGRGVVVTRAVPSPAADEPNDDELLRYLDGAMAPLERAAFERRLERSPYAQARLEILADALAENDPADA